MTVKNASAQMARTLSTLVGSGIPLVEAVEISANVMGNVYFKEALQYGFIEFDRPLRHKSEGVVLM